MPTLLGSPFASLIEYGPSRPRKNDSIGYILSLIACLSLDPRHQAIKAREPMIRIANTCLGRAEPYGGGPLMTAEKFLLV